MLKHLKILDDRLVECEPHEAVVLVFVMPQEEEKQRLIDEFHIDPHNINSALDPDELARLEFEPEHVALFFKRPKSYSSEDNFVFRVLSTGLFLYQDRLIIIAADDSLLLDGKPALKIRSLQDLILKMLFRSIHHFENHLKVINTISGELEQEINTAMENKHLLNLFTLEKSLVYYLNAISSNNVLAGKIRTGAARLGLTAENLEFLEDIVIETNQCHEQAQVYSNILASLMDARASIVANNLNVLMKTLNIMAIAVMLPTLVVSIFSMNVVLPIKKDSPWPFWFVVAVASASALAVALAWRRRKI